MEEKEKNFRSIMLDSLLGGIHKNLTFKQAYSYMLKGYWVKRPMMTGYWYINHLTGRLTIHLANGNEISREVDMQTTVMNIMAEDWEIVEK